MIDEFRARFGSAEGVRVYRAPGRVNLIGEHTDYNLGFVLPMALELATYVAATASGGDQIQIYSESRAESRTVRSSDLAGLEPTGHWADYSLGVARELVCAGFPVTPANLLIRSTVPEGAGLSSSAALEVATALALLAGRVIDPLDLARLCQRAEREFVGMPCGIMDQFISVFGRRGAAIEIDCRSLQHRTVQLPPHAVFFAVNSMVKHALAGSAYRDRVRECAEAAEAIGVSTLRDATPEMLDSARPQMSDIAFRRARHILTENRRVQSFENASPVQMGALMVESHRSLRDDYEVSCPELDFLADAAIGIEGVHGARMTGGGFGGCIVAMVHSESASAFKDAIADAYRRQFGMSPQLYSCTPSDGAAELNNLETIADATRLDYKSI